MNATTNIQTGEREAQSSSVRPVIDERQRQLAHHIALKLGGGMNAYAARVEIKILQALALFGGEITSYSTRTQHQLSIVRRIMREAGEGYPARA